MRVLAMVRGAWWANLALAVVTWGAGAVLVETKAHMPVPPRAVWPPLGDEPTVLAAPSPLAAVASIWTSWVDGPPPRAAAPPPPPPPPPSEDSPEWLRANVRVVGAFVARPSPATLLKVQVGRIERPLALGESVGGWRLDSVRSGERDASLVAAFRRVGGGDERVSLAAARPAAPPIDAPALLCRELDGPFAPARADRVERQAWFDEDAAAWQVPEEEVLWWRRFGEEAVLRRLETEPTARGLRLLSDPPHGPLDDARGFLAGDEILDVDGTAIRSVDGLVNALAGAAADGRIAIRFARGADVRVARFALLVRRAGS